MPLLRFRANLRLPHPHRGWQKTVREREPSKPMEFIARSKGWAREVGAGCISSPPPRPSIPQLTDIGHDFAGLGKIPEGKESNPSPHPQQPHASENLIQNDEVAWQQGVHTTFCTFTCAVTPGTPLTVLAGSAGGHGPSGEETTATRLSVAEANILGQGRGTEDHGATLSRESTSTNDHPRHRLVLLIQEDALM